jgi:hypothetical protein
MEIDNIESKVQAETTLEFGEVRQRVAEAFAVSVHSLHLIYKIEADKAQKKYRRLATQADWEEIVKFGRAHRLVQAGKNLPIDLWGVSIKDNEPGVAKSSKSRGNKVSRPKDIDR